MISEADVFEAVRRGYTELETSSNEEIIAHFAQIDTESSFGHINNIKGILFEQAYIDQLANEGTIATTFEATNHPVVDIAIIEDGLVTIELQLKATDSVSYISTTLQEHPDVPIVATSEVASHFSSDLVINSGIENAALESAVSESLFEEAFSPLSILRPLGWLFGLIF